MCELNRLMPLEEYQASRQQVFPSIQSLKWFVRQNRPELAEHGAIVAPTGRRLVVVDRFDEVVALIGRERVKRQRDL